MKNKIIIILLLLLIVCLKTYAQQVVYAGFGIEQSEEGNYKALCYYNSELNTISILYITSTGEITYKIYIDIKQKINTSGNTNYYIAKARSSDASNIEKHSDIQLSIKVMDTINEDLLSIKLKGLNKNNNLLLFDVDFISLKI